MNEAALDLQFPLVPGERRLEIPVEDAVLSAAVKPAAGRAKGLIVFVHGAASNASRWEEFVDKTALSENWALVRFDMRGHGGSSSRRPGRLEDHAADINAVMGAAGCAGSCIAVGHSLGAAAVLMHAKRFPGRTAGIALIDPLLEGCLTAEARAMEGRQPILRGLALLGSIFRAFGWFGLSRRLAPCRLRTMDEEARRMIAEGGEALEAFQRSYSSPLNDLMTVCF